MRRDRARGLHAGQVAAPDRGGRTEIADPGEVGRDVLVRAADRSRSAAMRRRPRWKFMPGDLRSRDGYSPGRRSRMGSVKTQYMTLQRLPSSHEVWHFMPSPNLLKDRLTNVHARSVQGPP